MGQNPLKEVFDEEEIAFIRNANILKMLSLDKDAAFLQNDPF